MTDYIALMAEVQRHILRVREMAAETNDPRKRDAYWRVADVIEQKVVNSTKLLSVLAAKLEARSGSRS